jgi:hypothetical protein
VAGVSADDAAALRRLADLTTPMALRVAVTLGIPARLRGDGDTVENLARELAVSPVGLQLLLAHLATIDVVERTDATEHPQLRDSFDTQMTARLVDLERTATGAAQTFQQRGLHERATAIAGSFFDPLPPGVDAYLLCDILHDWDDWDDQQILARCADAARPDSRILVIEAVGDRHTHTAHDLAMLVFYGGRDRHLHELSALAEPLGLLIDTVTDVSDHRTLVELRPSADTEATALSGELPSFVRAAQRGVGH